MSRHVVIGSAPPLRQAQLRGGSSPGMPVDESVSAGSGLVSVLSRFLAYGRQPIRRAFRRGRRGGLGMAESGVGGLAGE